MSSHASWSCCRNISSTADWGGYVADSAAVITIETFSLVRPETSPHHRWVKRDSPCPLQGCFNSELFLFLHNMMTRFLILNMVPTAWRRRGPSSCACSSGRRRCRILLHKCRHLLFVSGSASGLDVYHAWFKTNMVLGVGGVIWSYKASMLTAATLGSSFIQQP